MSAPETARGFPRFGGIIMDSFATRRAKVAAWLKEKGVAVAGKARGDQYVVIKVVPPSAISPRGQSLLKEFDHAEKFDPRASVPWKK